MPLCSLRAIPMQGAEQRAFPATKVAARNTGLDAEVRDLKTGYEAVEERARFELGLTKPDEVFVQTPQQK